MNSLDILGPAWVFSLCPPLDLYFEIRNEHVFKETESGLDIISYLKILNNMVVRHAPICGYDI